MLAQYLIYFQFNLYLISIYHKLIFNLISIYSTSDDIGEREIDFFQNRDLDLILTERATRFYDPKLSGIEKEKCILVAVDTKLETRRAHVESAPIFSLKESLR